jgi:hypothetical protein
MFPLEKAMLSCIKSALEVEGSIVSLSNAYSTLSQDNIRIMIILLNVLALGAAFFGALLLMGPTALLLTPLVLATATLMAAVSGVSMQSMMSTVQNATPFLYSHPNLFQLAVARPKFTALYTALDLQLRDTLERIERNRWMSRASKTRFKHELMRKCRDLLITSLLCPPEKDVTDLVESAQNSLEKVHDIIMSVQWLRRRHMEHKRSNDLPHLALD